MVVTSGRRIVELPHADAKDATRVVMLRDAKDDVRVLVVGLGNAHETSFELPESLRTLRSRCGKTESAGAGRYVFRAGAISCDLLE